MDVNYCKQVRKQRPPPRRRYVTEAEYAGAYAEMPPMLRCAMDLAVLTGLRPADLLSLTRNNLTDEGIEIATSKTGKVLLIEWSDSLKAVVDRAFKLEPRARQPIICTRRGQPYTVDGIACIVRRRIQKAISDEENPLAETFSLRDLRAKSASDDTLEHAQRRLGHTSSAMTQRTYRRKAERVRPLR